AGSNAGPAAPGRHQPTVPRPPGDPGPMPDPCRPSVSEVPVSVVPVSAVLVATVLVAAGPIGASLCTRHRFRAHHGTGAGWVSIRMPAAAFSREYGPDDPTG